MTFILKRKGPNSRQVSKIIANSEVLKPGEAVRLASGFVVTCPAGSSIWGVVQSIVGKNGEMLRTNGGSGDFNPEGDYTAASDNQTVAQVKAMVLVGKDSAYSVTADDTLATTTGSNLAGYLMDHTSGGLVLDESTAATSSAQWISEGLDPETNGSLVTGTGKVVVRIYEDQFDA